MGRAAHDPIGALMSSLTDRPREALLALGREILPRRQRRLAKLRWVGARSRVLADRRPLPGLLVIGTMRGGTSSLFKYLGSHPELAPSVRKEVQYLTRYWDRGDRWYRAHFPVGTRRLAFEATPDYLFSPEAPGRAAMVVPGARLLVCLREPLRRAWSHHQHLVHLGLEHRSFEDAVRAEPLRMEEARRSGEAVPGAWVTGLYRWSYLARGHYAEQLARWLEHYPASAIHIVWSDRLFRSTDGQLDEIADFLGVARGAFHGLDRNHSRATGSHEARPPDDVLRSMVPAAAQQSLDDDLIALDELLADHFPHLDRPSWLRWGDRG